MPASYWRWDLGLKAQSLPWTVMSWEYLQLVPVHTVRFGDSMLCGARRVFAAFGAAMLSSFLPHTGSSPPVEPFLVLSLLSAAYGLGKL